MPILLPTSYLPSVSYFAHLQKGKEVKIDEHELFPKQTFRNRTTISGANGVITLIVPVEKGRSGKTPVRDIRISNTENWKRNHWRTIVSAYKNSPYFEFFEHELEVLYRNTDQWLVDWNFSLMQQLCMWLKWDKSWETGQPEPTQPNRDWIDYRNIDFSSNQKHIYPTYNQVFSDRFPFLPNLSVIDLIFNQGPELQSFLPDIETV